MTKRSKEHRISLSWNECSHQPLKSSCTKSRSKGYGMTRSCNNNVKSTQIKSQFNALVSRAYFLRVVQMDENKSVALQNVYSDHLTFARHAVCGQASKNNACCQLVCANWTYESTYIGWSIYLNRSVFDEIPVLNSFRLGSEGNLSMLSRLLDIKIPQKDSKFS